MNNIPIITNIRKIIFEKFNDIDLRFNNDQIFEILKQNEMVDPSMTIDNMEVYFKELCDAEILRNIAQNFTTQWFKLFEPIEKIQCGSCKKDNYITQSENRTCQNSSCGSTLSIKLIGGVIKLKSYEKNIYFHIFWNFPS